MLSLLARLFLVSTAMAPILLVYGIMAYVAGKKTDAGWFLLACVLLVLACLFMLWSSKRRLAKQKFKATKAEATDRENASFLLLYVLPLFVADYNDLNWLIWIPVLILFALFAATGYSYHCNPMLGLMGWHFYRVAGDEGITYLLITKRHLTTVDASMEIAQLAEYILLDTTGQS